MKKLLALGALLCAATAHAACAPSEDKPGVSAEVLEETVSAPEGPMIVWACWRLVPYQGGTVWRVTSLHCDESTWAALGTRPLATLGGRVDTIRKATDPVAAWRTARKRYTTRESPRCKAAIAQYTR